MTIGFINAMHKEHTQLLALLQGAKESKSGPFSFAEGTFGSHHIVLMESGIGKVNAAIGCVELIHRHRPDFIINTGVAGGIDASLQVMDVVVGHKVAYHDVDCGPENEAGQVQGLPLYYESNHTLYNKALSLTERALALPLPTRIVGGLIASGDQFITDKAQLKAIKAQFPEALAVDMESGALAQTCHIYQVPFLSFRIVSDTPGSEEHFAQYQDFWETMANKSFGVVKLLLESLCNDSSDE